MRGMEACKSEQEGLKREKEEKLYASLEGLKAELDAYRKRTSTLDGEPTLTGAFAFEVLQWHLLCTALHLQPSSLPGCEVHCHEVLACTQSM